MSANMFEVIVVARIAERVAIIGAAVWMLWLAYRLFDHASAASQALGDGQVEFGKLFKIQFWRVGPGVFFAAFATVLLGVGEVNDIKVAPTCSPDDASKLMNLINKLPEADRVSAMQLEIDLCLPKVDMDKSSPTYGRLLVDPK